MTSELWRTPGKLQRLLDFMALLLGRHLFGSIYGELSVLCCIASSIFVDFFPSTVDLGSSAIPVVGTRE